VVLILSYNYHDVELNAYILIALFVPGIANVVPSDDNLRSRLNVQPTDGAKPYRP